MAFPLKGSFDFIGPIEKAAMKIPKARADDQRGKVRQALKKLKPPKPNISKEERLALKSLQSDENIIILPAYKGSTTVVMDKVEYSNKLSDLIGKGGNCKVKNDPTLKTKRKLSQIHRKNKYHNTNKIQTANSASCHTYMAFLRFIRMVLH